MSDKPHDEMITVRMPVWAFQGIMNGIEKWAGDHWDSFEITHPIESLKSHPRGGSSRTEMRISVATSSGPHDRDSFASLRRSFENGRPTTSHPPSHFPRIARFRLWPPPDSRQPTTVS